MSFVERQKSTSQQLQRDTDEFLMCWDEGRGGGDEEDWREGNALPGIWIHYKPG